MASMSDVAMKFFEACEAGKGWEACKSHCAPNASFSSQAEPLADVKTLAQYADWMQGLMKMMPDGRYDLKSFATDARRNNVTAYAVFKATHTGEGGPPPDRQEHQLRLCLRDGFRGRQDQAHDQDLEFRLGFEGAGLVAVAAVSFASCNMRSIIARHERHRRLAR